MCCVMRFVFVWKKRAFPSFDNALEANRAGAYDYLSKPFELEQIQIAVCRATRSIELEDLEALQQYDNSKEKVKPEIEKLLP